MALNELGLKAPVLSTEIFGGVLDTDSSGSYPGLELINFILCVNEGVLPSVNEVNIRRSAHDFARRLIWDDTLSSIKKSEVLMNDHSEIAIRKLLKCLELPLPNITKQPTWKRIHFFPYTKSLVHWDARLNRSDSAQVSIERQYLRGAGAYAYNVLRFDKNIERLEQIRAAFIEIYLNNEQSPLESLAKTLKSHGKEDELPVEDIIESRSRSMFDDEMDELYRVGMSNILSHKNLSSATKIRAIVNWTGIWFIIMGNFRAQTTVADSPAKLIIDCAGTSQQLRRSSQRSLKDFLKRINDSIDFHLNGRHITGHQSQKIKGFFASTAATTKLINSLKGRRHFTFGLDCIETLAMASVTENSEVPFEEFVHEWLYKKMFLIVDRRSAQLAGMLESLDATIFEENEQKLLEQLNAVGVLKVYSDATKMICFGDRNV